MENIFFVSFFISLTLSSLLSIQHVWALVCRSQWEQAHWNREYVYEMSWKCKWILPQYKASSWRLTHAVYRAPLVSCSPRFPISRKSSSWHSNALTVDSVTMNFKVLVCLTKEVIPSPWPSSPRRYVFWHVVVWAALFFFFYSCKHVGYGSSTC